MFLWLCSSLWSSERQQPHKTFQDIQNETTVRGKVVLHASTVGIVLGFHTRLLVSHKLLSKSLIFMLLVRKFRVYRATNGLPKSLLDLWSLNHLPVATKEDISHQLLVKVKAFPAWPGISMARQGDQSHRHGPRSSTQGESQGRRVQAPNGLAATLLPSAVSVTVEMKETKSKDCKQVGRLFLMHGFSLQQGRWPKAAWMVCNHQKRWHWK